MPPSVFGLWSHITGIKGNYHIVGMKVETALRSAAVIVLCVFIAAIVLKKSIFAQQRPPEAPSHQMNLAALVEIHTTSAPAHKSHGQPLRVMFVGDSITEGMSPNHSQVMRPLVPKEGACSYRFPLIRLLEQNMGVRLEPVGPFAGHVGSRATHEVCKTQLSHYIGGVSDRHASMWGITARELIGPSDLVKKRLHDRAYFFGTNSSQVRELDSDVTVAKLRDQHSKVGNAAFAERLEREHLRRWSYFLRPQLMTVHIGTNDLATGASAAAMVFDRWPRVILALLLPDVVFDGSTSAHSHEVQCSPPGAERRCIGITTILPRLRSTLPQSIPLHRSLIDESNAWLAQIQSCKAAAAGGGDACVSCVTKAVRAASLANRAQELPLNVVAETWCMRCVFVLNISSPSRINDSLQFMFDGLHPNSAGEQRIAEIMADELATSGALAYLLARTK
jgi:lysophospholipase L1-like esterase